MELVVRLQKKLPAFVLEADFRLPLGQTLVIFGPSGSGKTTLLRLLAGLEHPDEGLIRFGKEVFVDTSSAVFLPARERRLALVFQEGVLFPHLSLEKNVALTARDMALGEEYLRALGIWRLRKRRPWEVSGGERQRAALAQALARVPSLLLLDEPFSALDEDTKAEVIQVLKRFQKRYHSTVVVVTHQREDALCLSRFWLKVHRGKTVWAHLEDTSVGIGLAAG